MKRIRKIKVYTTHSKEVIIEEFENPEDALDFIQRQPDPCTLLFHYYDKDKIEADTFYPSNNESIEKFKTRCQDTL